MKMKLILLAAAFTMAVNLQSQTMKWVSVPGADKAGDKVCYALEYVPAVSGVLTSYTTGFHLSCTSRGSAITDNRSFALVDNVNLYDGCADHGVTAINASAHSGTAATGKVEAGKPVRVHQICLEIPAGEFVVVRKDDLIGLTSSINLENGEFQTEYIAFEEQIFRGRTDAPVIGVATDGVVDNPAFAVTCTPNPAIDFIMVDFPNHQSEVRDIRIFDLNGAEVLLVKPGKGAIQSRLDVSGLRVGAYTLRVTDADGAVHVENIVVAR